MIVVYAVLAVAGAVLPWYFNLQLASSGGLGLSSFLAGVFANPASSSIGVDILVGATAFNVWMVTEARRLRMKHVWVYLVLTFLVAFACACPLFLLMRERKLREQKAAGTT
jgi:ABC-type Fe3+-siderophore transport system permease subunit